MWEHELLFLNPLSLPSSDPRKEIVDGHCFLPTKLTFFDLRGFQWRGQTSVFRLLKSPGDALSMLKTSVLEECTYLKERGKKRLTGGGLICISCFELIFLGVQLPCGCLRTGQGGWLRLGWVLLLSPCSAFSWSGFCKWLTAQCSAQKQWKCEAWENTQADTVCCFPQLNGAAPSVCVPNCCTAIWLQMEGQLCYLGRRI